MYINGLGMRNAESIQTIGNGVNNTGRETTKTNNFDDNMQKAIDTWRSLTKTGQYADSESLGDSEEYCCEQCHINSQIIDRMMTQSLYMRSMPGSMSMLGLSQYGNSALSAYSSTLGLLGGSIFSNIQI